MPVLILYTRVLVVIEIPLHFVPMGSLFDNAVLVYKNSLAMCYILLAIDIPVAANFLVILPISP